MDRNSASINVTGECRNSFFDTYNFIPLFPFICWSLSPPSMEFSFSASSPCSEPSREAPAELSLLLALLLIVRIANSGRTNIQDIHNLLPGVGKIVGGILSAGEEGIGGNTTLHHGENIPVTQHCCHVEFEGDKKEYDTEN